MTSIVFSSWGNEIVDNRGLAAEQHSQVDRIQLPENFRQDEQVKALMGWNGLLIRSEEVNVVDLCRSYMQAVHTESCGKCAPCRLGTGVMADTLTKICSGQGGSQDMATLAEQAHLVMDTAKCQIGRSGPLPVLHAMQHFADQFEEAIAGGQEIAAGEYRSKCTAPCMDACPIHLNIPSYVEAIREARFEEALDIIRDRLPIPGVVGRVCVRPCEENCRRANLDEPISIKFLKRFVADKELAHQKSPDYPKNPSPKTGKVAVIGAGPAGLTCAYHLTQKGHEVVLFERFAEPGGMAAFGIPDYRLPRDILHGEAEEIYKTGVDVRYNTVIGKDITLSQLEEEYDAVFVGIGAQNPSPMWVEGEDAGYKGFITGVQYLLDINNGIDPYPEGKRVVVIGGGNVAIDCVRCSFRVNKKDVHLVYRRTEKEMPADLVEIHDAKEEEVQFHFLTAPAAIKQVDGKVVGLECIKMELGAPDASGRRRPVPIEGSNFVFDCDIIVPAIGQKIDLSLLESVEGIETTRWNSIVVNPATMQSNRPKIFSGGDCETGPDALITACAGGRRAAINIDRMINDQPVEADDEFSYDQLFKSLKVYDPKEDVALVAQKKRNELEMLPPDTRKFTFDEVEIGFSNQAAIEEASRCLRCYSVATIAV